MIDFPSLFHLIGSALLALVGLMTDLYDGIFLLGMEELGNDIDPAVLNKLVGFGMVRLEMGRAVLTTKGEYVLKIIQSGQGAAPEFSDFPP